MTRFSLFHINNERPKLGFGLFFSAVLTLLFLWPLWSQFSTHLPSREDGVFISYTIYWVAEALRTGQNIWHVPLFYPYTFTLAYSDPFLPTGLLTIPLLAVTNNLAVIHNLQLVLGTFLLAWGSWLLGMKLFKSWSAAVLFVVISTVAPLHWLYTVHLHTFLVWGIPFCLYFGCRWLETNQQRYFWLATGCFLYQALNAPMTGLFLTFILLPLLFQKNVRTAIKQHQYQVFLAVIAVGSILAITYYPYFWVSRHFEYVRTIRDAAHFSYSLNRLWQPDLVVVICLIAVFGWWAKNTTKTSPLISSRSFWLITLIGGVLMLGPVLKLNDQTFKLHELPIPLPYAPLYYLVPVFQGFRAVSRWGIVFNLGLALLAGYYLSRLQLHWVSSSLLLLFITAMFWMTQVPTWQLFAIPTKVPESYELIRNHPGITAELPALSWRMMPFSWWENDRLLYQTYHHQPLCNGTSGFTPPPRERELDWLWINFPSTESLRYLKGEGVTQILVHFNQYQILWAAHYSYNNHITPHPEELQRQLNTNSQLELQNCSSNACLYTIN